MTNARFFRDADPAGFILFRRNCENPGAAAAPDRSSARNQRPRRRADPDRPGRRARRAHAAARMAGLSRGGEVREAVSRRAVVRDRGGALQCPRAGADAAVVRDQRECAAAARRPPGGRDRHHRRPRAGLRADAGRGARPGGARRHGLGRRGRDHQAHAGPRPRAGRQPQGAAGRHRPAPKSWRSTSSRSSALPRRRWG